MTASSVVVVGGGVAGLLAAMLRARAGDHVTLVEAAEACGGLLRTTWLDGLPFDQGSHVYSSTGVDEVDELLLGVLPDREWIDLTPLRAAAYTAGRLSEQSQFAALDHLPQQQRAAIVLELLQRAAAPAPAATTLAGHLDTRFGPTLANCLHRPLMRRQTGLDAEELAPEALALFGLQRVIVGDSALMLLLKTNPALDEVLAFATDREGTSSSRSHYPRRGGIGAWTDALVTRLADMGVTVRTGCRVEAARVSGGRVRAVRVGTEPPMEIDELVWTLPTAWLWQLLPLPPMAAPPPRRRAMSLVHLAFDRPLSTSAQHVYGRDPALRTFRVTNYDGYGAADDALHRCTVEVMHDGEEEAGDLTASVLEDLAVMGLTDGRPPVHRYHRGVAAGFPVPTVCLAQTAAELRTTVAAAVANVHLLGRGAGRAFFQRDVLRDVHERMSG